VTGAGRAKQRLRERAEHHLRLAAMEEMRRRHPGGTVEPYRERRGVLWRRAFVPLYTSVPWGFKVRAMRALRMTAESSGWSPPPRRPGEPWRPPATR
jgi:hypothetical protein